MPRYRRYSDDDYRPVPIVIERKPEVRARRSSSHSDSKRLSFGLRLLKFFQPPERVVRIVEQPVRRRRQQRVERYESPENSPSPPGMRRVTAREDERDDFVPLPDIIPRQPAMPPRPPPPPRERYPGYDVEVARPGSRRPEIERRQPSHDAEIIEVVRPQSGNMGQCRASREAEQRYHRERQARKAAERANDLNHDLAMSAQQRMDDLAQQVGDFVFKERHERRSAEVKAQDARARAERLAQELAHEKRRSTVAEREKAILERERRLEAEDRAVQMGRGRPPPLIPSNPRPVDIHQPIAPDRDPGGEAIRRAQEDERRRVELRRRQDELLYRNRMETHPNTGGRRGSVVTYDDDNARTGPRRR